MDPQDIKLTGFELLELLGKGGMGVVWKARQLSLDRLVAIKFLHEAIRQNPDSIKQLMSEARMAAKLKHSGIVQVYDAHEEHGHCFFVMEFVEGYSVGQWLSRSKLVPWKDALLVVESVAVALDYAWRTAGMIHCDVKPENIMVDKDGTIKVADLGLSRTLDSRSGQDESEVTGTPSYMSPEQVYGDVELDCRTDIYSLGALLYQMVTGKRPFAEKPDREIMEGLLTEQIPDPRDIVPGIPTPVCALLERLMAKDRDERPKDWLAVIRDIQRVEKGVMPITRAPIAGDSTVNCRKVSSTKAHSALPKVTAESGQRFPFLAFLLFMFGAVAVLFWYVYLREDMPKGIKIAALFHVGGTPATESAAQCLELARRWEDEHPRQYQEARIQYQGVVARFPGTPQAALAMAAMKVLAERSESERGQVWAGLTNRVQQLVKQGRLEPAISMLESYTGAWAAETVRERTQLARDLRQMGAERDMARVEEGNWQQFLDKSSELIMAGKWIEAQQMVSQSLAQGQFKIHKADVEAIDAILRAAASLGDPVLQSFQKDIGTVIGLKLTGGVKSCKIVAIAGRKIIVETTNGRTTAQVFIDPGELIPAERVIRLGTASTPAEALVKGVAAAGLRAIPEAAEFLKLTSPILSGRLLERLRELEAIPSDEAAISALAGVLTQAGVSVGPYDEAQWSAAIRASRLTYEQAARMSGQRDKFLEDFGTTAFLIRASPVLLLLDRTCQQALEAPPVSNGSRDTAAVTSAGDEETAAVKATEGKGMEDVKAALMEKNPGLLAEDVQDKDGIEGPGLLITSDEAVDVSPLAGRSGIRSLRVESAGGLKVLFDLKNLAGTGVTELRLKGHVVKDLAAVRGLRLKRLVIPGTTVAGFAPLAGMPLVELDLSGSSIRDLNPLIGMRLESLNLDGTKVVSLMTLAGMPLRELSMRGAPVRDVSALASLPLESLDLAQTMVFDYQVLRGLRLKRLNLSGAQIRDVSFCGGMALKELILENSSVTDISALKGMALDHLVLAKTQVKDISPLAGSSIGSLDLTGLNINAADLAAVLSKVNVTNLNLAETGVNTISFLKGKQLVELNLRGTRVRDLTPLKGMPLNVINLKDVEIGDFSPLKSVPLTEIWVTGERWKNVNALRDFPQLRSVNGRIIRTGP
ncbi:MAG: protein kinase [bacterium]